MPIDKVAYYNRIDTGIFLLFIELCFKHNKVKYDRKLLTDNSDDTMEKVLVARYNIL
jgi:hypothetical protein